MKKRWRSAMQLQTTTPRLIACCALLAGTVANAASLDIDVTHLRPTKTVRVSVFADAKSWARGGTPIMSRVFDARDVSQTLHIDGLAPGRYAVRVDQEPNSSAAEVPSFRFERHGSSGNAARYGSGSFERAAVNVRNEGARVSVHMFMSDRL
jgi:uncharacterized protein (DUF2141 family)